MCCVAPESTRHTQFDLVVLEFHYLTFLHLFTYKVIADVNVLCAFVERRIFSQCDGALVVLIDLDRISPACKER